MSRCPRLFGSHCNCQKHAIRSGLSAQDSSSCATCSSIFVDIIDPPLDLSLSSISLHTDACIVRKPEYSKNATKDVIYGLITIVTGPIPACIANGLIDQVPCIFPFAHFEANVWFV